MQQANGVGAAADGDFSAMQEATMPFFTSGTVLRFDLDSDDATDSTTLDYRAIRPVFGGKEGGVRHCEYKRVCSCCQHARTHLYNLRIWAPNGAHVEHWLCATVQCISYEHDSNS